jgi:hypothetical protein
MEPESSQIKNRAGVIANPLMSAMIKPKIDVTNSFQLIIEIAIQILLNVMV